MIRKRRCGSKRRRMKDEEGEAEVEDDEDKGGVWSSGNKIYFHSSVSRNSVKTLIGLLDKASKQWDSLFLFVHSEGGDAYAGLSAMDHIRKCKAEVSTVVDGYCASSGTLLLLGGRKRFCMQHGTILIHQLQTGFFGKYGELVEEMKNSEQLMTILKEVYSDSTEIPAKKLQMYLSTETNMTAKESVALGVTNGIW